MIFTPPQHGKSTLVSIHLPAFWLGHHPDLPVALTSYGADLATRNSRAARDIVEGPFYQEVFPGVLPDPRNWREADWHIYKHKGMTRSAGVGGPITGYGFGLMVIDDPFEGWVDAQSETIRESVWQWYDGTFRTRLWEGGKVVLIMTRWHEDDLAGRILETEGLRENGGRWKVYRYTALADPSEDAPDIIGRKYDEPLSPSRFSKKHLVEVRSLTSPFIWHAEYQQRPTRPTGNLFKIGRVDIVDSVPAEVADVKWTGKEEDLPVLGEVRKGVRFWDLAATEESRESRDPDWLAGALLAEHAGLFYWLDLQHARLEPEQGEELMKLTAKVDGRRVKIRLEQEPAASGKSYGKYLVRMLAGFPIEVKPKGGDKTVKATPFASQVNAGNVRMLRAAWNKKALDEMAGFPHAGHDDIVDSGSGAFNDLTEQAGEWSTPKFRALGQH